MTTMKEDARRRAMRRLEALLSQATRMEQDIERRLQARLTGSAAARAHATVDSDPVAKRLRFLAADARVRRQAVERELAMRSATGSAIAAASARAAPEPAG